MQKQTTKPTAAEQFEADMIKGINNRDRRSGPIAELERAYGTIAMLQAQIQNAELAAIAKRKKQKHRRAVATCFAVIFAAISALLASWGVTSYWVTAGVLQVCLIVTCVCFALEIASAKG